MKQKVKINFILPFKPRRPAGGFRVMYEYANRLKQKGYEIHLTFPLKTKFMDYRFPYLGRWLLSKIEGFRTYKWFDFDPGITMSYVPEIKDSYVNDSDVVIATWWATVMDMGSLSPDKGKKINLIQGFENWDGHEDLLFKSYNIKDTINVVVASYLKDIVSQHTSNKIELIESGIDDKVYHIKNPIKSRLPYTVAMNYSPQPIKGSRYGLDALFLVKERLPELQVELFSIFPEPEGLPDWIKFYRNPDNLADIYNRNAIFISNSFTEGFGLVSVESMFCGCALICTDIQGHKEYAFDGDTALLVTVKDVNQMAEKITYLINNITDRIALAQRGNDYVQRFKWDNAVEKMEQVVLDRLSERE